MYNITGGAVPYEQAWMWQQRLLHERMAWQREETPDHAASHDVLLLLEHPPVYTLGRGSSLDHLRFDPTDSSSSRGREVRRTERGGEVTWHGPGQIVGYPVLDLNFHKKDLHWYLRQLEEVSECLSTPAAAAAAPVATAAILSLILQHWCSPDSTCWRSTTLLLFLSLFRDVLFLTTATRFPVGCGKSIAVCT